MSVECHRTKLEQPFRTPRQLLNSHVERLRGSVAGLSNYFEHLGGFRVEIISSCYPGVNTMSNYNTKEAMTGQQDGGGAWAARWRRGQGWQDWDPRGPPENHKAGRPWPRFHLAAPSPPPSCYPGLTPSALELNIQNE